MTEQTSHPDPEDLPALETLPDVLTFADRSPVTTPTEWRERRRAELVDLFRHYVYGFAPQPVPVRELDRRVLDSQALGGAGTLTEIDLALGEGEDTIIHLLLATPNEGEGPHPVFLYLNYCGNQAVISHEGVRVSDAWIDAEPCGGSPSPRGHQQDRWPWEMALRRGYAMATFHESDIDPDQPDFSDGVHAQFTVDAPARAQWGTLAAWAWGLSRAVDHLITEPAIDRSRIAVFGHSRRGKAALWAAAQDERIGLAVINQSGTGGATLSRSSAGESVQQINDEFPHWFNDMFPAFNGRETHLPIDQHELLALVAPRPMLLNNAEEDTWADPEGSWRAAKAADPVYKLLGSPGIVQNAMAAFDPASTLSFRLRPGAHSVTHADWAAIFDFADGQGW